MAENREFNSVVDSLLRGMNTMASAKTVIGDAIRVDDTIILPLIDITFGIGAGTALNDSRQKNGGGGGMAAKMSPSAVLLIKDGVTRLVNVKNQSTITKILDMAPDFVDRFMTRKSNPQNDPKVKEAIDHAFDEGVEV